MNQIEDLEKLAEICLAKARTVKNYLASKKLPQPTFDQNGPTFSPQMDEEAETARVELRGAAQQLLDLASGPEGVLGQDAHNKLEDLAAIRYVLHFKIATAIPYNDTISYADLATKTKTDEQELKTMLRQLIQIHVFAEPQPGLVSHSAASKHFETDVSSWAGFTLIDRLPWILRQIEAIEKWGHGSPEPNQTGANLFFQSDVPCYVTFAEHPVTQKRFNDLMNYLSRFDSWSISHAVDGFDWASLDAATIVDIGGNMGHCSVAFASKNPKADFIIQDLPAVVARATDISTSIVPASLRPRITFVSHDFNAPQPVIGADVYFLRMILHNYSDKYCAKILGAIVPAMRSNSRILIMDTILPVVGSAPAVAERVLRTMDMTMLQLFNAHERDQGDWEKLFALVDPRLRVKSVVHPKGAVHSMMEVVLEGGPAK